MKIVLASPLYPPDIAEPAPYIKELARRLAPRHEVVIVAYGRLPEPLTGVRIRTVDKRLPLPARLFLFAIALWQESRGALLYAQSGASVELPAAVTGWRNCRLIIGASDTRAQAHAERSLVFGTIARLAHRRAAATIHEIPPPRPEVLPFAPYPAERLDAWDRSWTDHVHMIETRYAK